MENGYKCLSGRRGHRGCTAERVRSKGKCKDYKMKKRNEMGSGVTSLQYVTDAKKQQARSLRKQATPAEVLLWDAIRNRKAGGFKFRRQQVIEGFVTDFFCESVKLAIEVDGGVHEVSEQLAIDIHREKVFGARGIFTLRLKNEDVMNNLQETIDLIVATADKRI